MKTKTKNQSYFEFEDGWVVVGKYLSSWKIEEIEDPFDEDAPMRVVWYAGGAYDRDCCCSANEAKAFNAWAKWVVSL